MQKKYDFATLKKNVDGKEYTTFWMDTLLQMIDTKNGKEQVRAVHVTKMGLGTLVKREGKAKRSLEDGVHLRLSSNAINK